MPNRIIKESICTSDSLDSLSWFEECFFYRLLVNCDDYGRMDARPAVLKSRLFPLKERIALKDVKDALGKLADIGCVRLYECDGKPYLYLPAWEVHQSIRAKRSKYPAPDDGITCMQMNADEITCMQVNADAPVIQSESNPNPKPNPNPNARAELFARFWDSYPKKKAKQDAQKAWDKLKPDEDLSETIIAAVYRLAATQDWTKDGGRYVPYPATFLNGRRWEDDIGPAQSRYSNLERLYQEMEGKDDD